MLNDLIVFNNSFFSFLSLLFSSINIENITFIITTMIDILAIAIIIVTIIQTILYLIKRYHKPLLSFLFIPKEQQLPNIEQTKQSNYNYYNVPKKNIKDNIKRNFISGLLLALEFETANVILKMGIYITCNR
jgi:hypothetical protein